MSPVQIHGTTYATVAERLKLARGEGNAAPTGVVSIETEALAVGNLAVMRATVRFETGQVFTGHSLVNMQATGPAERDAPLETAETSAVGRALAFAGYHGSDEGIAGAEEIHLAERRSQFRGQEPVVPVNRSGYAPGAAQITLSGPSPAQVRYFTKLWSDAGRPMPPPDVTTTDRREVSKQIEALQKELGVPPITGRQGG